MKFNEVIKHPEDILRAAVKDFLQETAIPPTNFGLESTGDAAIVKHINNDGITKRRARRVWDYMEKTRPGTMARYGFKPARRRA